MTERAIAEGEPDEDGGSVASSVVAELTAIQQTVSYYGTTELELLERIAREGRRFLDAFILQEHLLLRLNNESEHRIVSVFPSEGVAWADHPVALIRRPGQSADQIQTFHDFCNYLLTPEAQLTTLSHGLRPVCPEFVDYIGAERKRARYGFVDSTESPRAQLIQVPADSPRFRSNADALFLKAKRSVNVLLLVDVSGSMNGDKLSHAQAAVGAFVENFESPQDRIGLIEFDSRAILKVPCDYLETNRDRLVDAIAGLHSTGGRTALMDAIHLAYARLQEMQDEGRINAIVVLSDGLDNASRVDVDALTSVIDNGNERGTPVCVYCIAYGGDADFAGLERIATASRGRAHKGSLMEIRRLYETMSRLF